MSVSQLVDAGKMTWIKPTNLRTQNENKVKNKLTPVILLWNYTLPLSDMSIYWRIQINDNEIINLFEPTYTFIPFGEERYSIVRVQSVYKYKNSTNNIKDTNLGISEWSEEVKIFNNKDKNCSNKCNLNDINNNNNSNNVLLENNNNISSKMTYGNSVKNKNQISSYSGSYIPCFKLG